MHVILEGVLPLHCKFLLMHCIFKEHYFTLKLVNKLISEFEYGYSESRNVPRQLDNDHLKSSESKLSQSGTRTCVFGGGGAGVHAYRGGARGKGKRRQGVWRVEEDGESG
jgi:hypothetical protein